MTFRDVYDCLYRIYDRLTSDDDSWEEVRSDVLLLVTGLLQRLYDEL